MSASSTKGISKVEGKLEKSIQDGQYYEAQQMYKTLYFRYTSQKKYSDVISLLTNGAINQLTHHHWNEGTELALLLLSTYNQLHTKVTQESLEPIIKMSSLYDGNSEDANTAKQSLLQAAIKWTAAEGENKQGEPVLHNLCAESYWRQGSHAKAQKHFLRGNQPELFAQMLAEWACSPSLLPNERDLLLARGVLKYLCFGNLKDANILFETVLKLIPDFPQTPLINFVRFLLLTLERDAYPLFDMLRQKYKPSLDHDPSLHQYLGHIGQVFFNVKPAGGNSFNDFLKSLFSGGTDQE